MCVSVFVYYHTYLEKEEEKGMEQAYCMQEIDFRTECILLKLLRFIYIIGEENFTL